MTSTRRKPLVACELFAHELRELVQIDALAPLLLREAHDLLDVRGRDAEVLAHGAQDALALLLGEHVVRVGDLEQQRAGRDGHGVGRCVSSGEDSFERKNWRIAWTAHGTQSMFAGYISAKPFRPGRAYLEARER